MCNTTFLKLDFKSTLYFVINRCSLKWKIQLVKQYLMLNRTMKGKTVIFLKLFIVLFGHIFIFFHYICSIYQIKTHTLLQLFQRYGHISVAQSPDYFLFNFFFTAWLILSSIMGVCLFLTQLHVITYMLINIIWNLNRTCNRGMTFKAEQVIVIW